jgi:hypothetical protein
MPCIALRSWNVALSDRIPPWEGTSLAERLTRCRMLLRIHGFLTDAESERVKSRMFREYEAEHRTPRKQAVAQDSAAQSVNEG